ncbi:aminomethyl-transferring glycine dehydrogenase subunit GcvPB [Elusimicrobiota bacterium]
MKLIFEKSICGRTAINIPDSGVDECKYPEKQYLRTDDIHLPEMSELDIVRHFTNLSKMNFSVDSNFYPLGSCTMKYNPKILERIASLNGFTAIHPFLAYIKSTQNQVQGALEVLFDLQNMLADITGMDKVSLQPLAGAQGELAGILIAQAYHKSKQNRKKYIIIPDASHGTNPASAAMAGYEIISIPTSSNGQMDLSIFKEKITNDVAAVIMTCPNTLGIFNTDIKEICDIAHSVDSLMYYDGANLNAILGKVKPADIGFDIVHINLHKTFATPHGGGGPGAGPLGVKDFLADFLPVPFADKNNSGSFCLSFDHKYSIGQMAPFYGNFSVLLKAYAYILLIGKNGLSDISDKAVLNANYIMEKLKDYYKPAYDRRCMHECVLSAADLKEKGVRAADIAKYLIDAGIHPPTVYFPLIVEEALMIEPTETESKETLDIFINAMIDAFNTAVNDPQRLKDSPLSTPVKRPDETLAARKPNLRYNT